MQNPAKLTNQLLNDGIIENARVDLKINKEAIARKIKDTLENKLSKVAGYGAFVNAMSQKDSAPAFEFKNNANNSLAGTIEIYMDRTIGQLETVIQQVIKKNTLALEENGVDAFAKIIPHDDGSKYSLSIRKSSFEAMTEGRTMEVDGIVDRSDIPVNKEEMESTAKQIMGMDGEAGKIVVDGQNLLKALQGMVMGKHRLNGEETIIDKDIEQLQFLSKYMPALQATIEGDYIVIELDMEKLKTSMAEFLVNDLNKVKGIQVTAPNDENPTTVTAHIDYKALADQTMQVVSDQLMAVNGVRVTDDRKGTDIVFSTDLRNQENLVFALQNQIAPIVKALGQKIAGEIEDQTPPSLIASVQKYFLKQPEQPQMGV